MFVMMGRTAWTHILTHQGAWEPYEAVAWCAWAAYATLSLFGIYHTLRMLPIMLFMVFTKYSGWWWLPISLVENGYTQGLSC